MVSPSNHQNNTHLHDFFVRSLHELGYAIGVQLGLPQRCTRRGVCYIRMLVRLRKHDRPDSLCSGPNHQRVRAKGVGASPNCLGSPIGEPSVADSPKVSHQAVNRNPLPPLTSPLRVGRVCANPFRHRLPDVVRTNGFSQKRSHFPTFFNICFKCARVATFSPNFPVKAH